MTPERKLRDELLVSGLYDIVPLIEIQSEITKEQRATAEQQQHVLSLMRSLVEDGLMEFVGWETLPLDESMARVHDRYVKHHDDPGKWVFAVWLRLTDAGKRVAEELEAAEESDD